MKLARWTAWGMAALVALLTVAYVALYLSVLPHAFDAYGFPGGVVLFALTGSIFGALIVGRQPRNGVGWILLASGLMLIVVSDAQLYAVRNAFVAPGSLPLQWLAAWLGSWMWAPGVGIITVFLPLLIPDGRLGSRPAKLLAVVAVLAVATPTIATASITFSGTGAVQVGSDGQLTGSHSLNNAGAFGLLYAFLPLVALAAVIRMVVRLRRAHGDERQQLKWFAAALAVVLIGLAASAVGNVFDTATPLRAEGGSLLSRITAAIFVATFSAVPIGAGVSVLKYRLYDIDIVINRTLVYGAMAVFITGIYVLIAVGAGTLVGSGGKPNLGLSILATALVALAFQPVRERVQRFANRLAYGKRATPYEVLSELSDGLREAFGGEDIMQRIARVLREGTGALEAQVWVRVAGQEQLTAAYPQSATAGGEERSVAVRAEGEELGSLRIRKRSGESLTPIEEKLVSDLAAQAGLVMRNQGLTAALRQHVEELRASRQRLVSAQDAERRRLERNLHDGAQQNLVALKVKLGILESVSEKDPGKAKLLVTQLKDDTDEAIEILRDLARGIYPPLLADKGLIAALEAQARKATLPVSVSGDGIDRYPQDIEAAIYFCCLEALQNVQKYAQATAAEVSLTSRNSSLVFKVSDNGMGFDPATSRKGSGLQNMQDRLDALGGSLVVTSQPGKGTQVTGALPVSPAVSLAR